MEPEDLELLYEWENNEENWRQSSTLVPYSRYTLKRYIATSHKNIFETGQLRLMIELLPEKRTVGTIDLFDFDHFHRRAGVGILIGDTGDRNKGIGSAAVKALIRYAGETLGMHQLWCNILEGNEESMRLFQRHGFNLCGTRSEWVLLGDKYLTEYQFQLILP